MMHNEGGNAATVSPAVPFRGQAGARRVRDPAAQAGAALPASIVAVGRWLESPIFKRSSLVALGVWAIVGFWDIASAIIEQRQGAWMASITAAVVLLAALVSSIAGFAFS